MEKLLGWLKQNNVNIDNLKIINQQNKERGVVSAKNITQGDFVFLIPHNLIITNKTADSIPEIRDLNNTFSDKSETELNIIKITIFMLFAEEFDGIMQDVDWTPYFDTLPETLEHIPIFWDEELDFLKGSYLVERIRERKRFIREEYRILKRVVPDFDQFNLYEYQRMRSLVSSRNFKLNMHNEVVSAMVPFADMLNHSNTCQTRWSYNNELKSYQMVAKTNISVGDEIMDSYGIKPMDNYFIFYGFVLPDSEVRLYLKFKDFKGYITSDINSSQFKSLLNFFRNKQTKNYYTNHYQNKNNEIICFEQIFKLLKQVKKKYPHTKRYYDNHKNTNNQNKKNAYTIISGELNLIDTLLEKIMIIIKYLNNRKVSLKYSDVEKYILENIIRQ